MTTRSEPLSQSYKEAIQANDPARASEIWRAAQAPAHETERKIMIQELDFSLVESYSLAQSADDRDRMAAIWSMALNTPNNALTNMLYEVDRRDMESDLPTEESPEVTAGRNQKALIFLKTLPGFSFLETTPGAPDQNADTPGFTASELLHFANDPARRGFCGLTQPEIEALKSLKNMLLPGPDSHGSMKQWARDHHLELTDSQIEKIRKTALLMQNRMAPADANMLAMAARSALGKKGKGPTPTHPAQEQPQPPSENDPKAANMGLPE